MTKLAIDFGSQITKIDMLGCGIVLSEATCVAVEQALDGNGRYVVKACGDKARALYGRAAKNTQIINPVFEGDIVNPALAATLLAYFLQKIEITPRKASTCEVIFILPCGSEEALKDKYFDMGQECGLGKVHFTQTPYAAVLGHNVTLSESNPVFCVDIGYGMTNIATFSLDGMIAGISVNLGGGNIDVHIMDELAERNNFRVGALTAERIKNTVGSLLPDDNKMMVADGRDLKTGTPVSMAIDSSKILDIITLYLDKIVEYILLVISKLPAEVASSVMRGGVYLSGGLAKMDGIADYLFQKLNIPVNMPEEPQYASVIGAGTILSSSELLEQLAEE
jgi:rod shape-determining protein MreB